MKQISRIFLYCISLLCSQGAICNDGQPLYHALYAWFKHPQDILHWKLTQSTSQSTLIATSKKMGGGHIYYTPNNQPCIVSIPHQFYDIGTQVIGDFIYQELCQLMLSNSHQRYTKSPDKDPMDLAKRPMSIHNAALIAYQAHNPTAKVFQIHGFSNKKRKTRLGKKADIIVSQGKKSNSIGAQLTTCFTKLGYISHLYGTTIRELGGTKNIAHKLGLKPHSFIHIELNKTTRLHLRQDPILLEKFTSCLSHIL